MHKNKNIFYKESCTPINILNHLVRKILHFIAVYGHVSRKR